MATLKSLKNKYLSASDGAVLGVTTNTENISALSFKLATADSLSKFNMVDGFSDDYNDATGVDSGASTDATRNSANYYSGSGTSAGSTGFTVASPAAGQTFTVPAGVSSVDIKRSMGSEKLRDIITSKISNDVEIVGSVTEACIKAQEETKEGSLILIFGSFYTVAEAFPALKILRSVA